MEINQKKGLYIMIEYYQGMLKPVLIVAIAMAIIFILLWISFLLMLKKFIKNREVINISGLAATIISALLFMLFWKIIPYDLAMKYFEPFKVFFS